MKIALVTAYFYPTSQGGTEKYVLNFAEHLIARKNEVEVITARSNEFGESMFQEIKIKYIPDEPSIEYDILNGKQAAANLSAFKKLLIEGTYDIVHFHTLTPAFNLFHIGLAKKLTRTVQFTAHTPSITCIHGDLMLFGKKACDGLVENQRCTACYISKKGFNKAISKIIAEGINISRRPKSIAEVAKNKIADLRTLNDLCDEIFLFTSWQKDIFLKNGFDKEKLKTTNQFLGEKLVPEKKSNKTIKNIGFIGRITHEKGLHILLKVFNTLKRSDFKLYIAGISNDSEYFKRLKKKSEKNPNIIWQLNLSTLEMEAFYKKIDVLVIPSITYETGPFVLYEAIKNNLPVIVNDLGDMKVWQRKGFNISLYSNPHQLKNLFNNLKLLEE